MARLSDPTTREVITSLYEAAKEAERVAQAQLDLSSDLLRVASALHDLMLNEPALRVVAS